MSRPYKSSRKAALGVLNSGIRLTGKGGQFLGQLAADDPKQLSDKQLAWLHGLLKRADLSSFINGDSR